MFLKQHFANSEHFYKSTLVEGKPVIWLQSVQEELKSELRNEANWGENFNYEVLMSFLVTHTCNECQKLHGFVVSGFKLIIKLYLSVDVNKHILGLLQIPTVVGQISCKAKRGT